MCLLEAKKKIRNLSQKMGNALRRIAKRGIKINQCLSFIQQRENTEDGSLFSQRRNIKLLAGMISNLQNHGRLIASVY